MYQAIAEYSEKNNFEIEDFGKEIIGEQFILLRDPDYDKVISFVLTGSSGNGSVFTCIYTDYE